MILCSRMKGRMAPAGYDHPTLKGVSFVSDRMTINLAVLLMTRDQFFVSMFEFELIVHGPGSPVRMEPEQEMKLHS